MSDSMQGLAGVYLAGSPIFDALCCVTVLLPGVQLQACGQISRLVIAEKSH